MAFSALKKSPFPDMIPSLSEKKTGGKPKTMRISMASRFEKNSVFPRTG
jgi:hypothetical protein